MRLCHCIPLLFVVPPAFAVTGGVPTNDPRFDGVVSIAISSRESVKKPPAKGTCTASIIGPNLLLTAGHCVENVREKNPTIRVFGRKEFARPRSFQVASIDIHPGANFQISCISKDGKEECDREIWSGVDLATIRVTESLRGPIYPIIEAASDLENVNVITAGYGCDRLRKQQPSNLLLTGTRSTKISDEDRLTLLQSEKSSICSGDSGGPVFREDQNGQLIIAGVMISKPAKWMLRSEEKRLKNGALEMTTWKELISEPFSDDFATRVDQEFDFSHNYWLRSEISK